MDHAGLVLEDLDAAAEELAIVTSACDARDRMVVVFAGHDQANANTACGGCDQLPPGAAIGQKIGRVDVDGLARRGERQLEQQARG
jgi:hypothetical protein